MINSSPHTNCRGLSLQNLPSLMERMGETPAVGKPPRTYFPAREMSEVPSSGDYSQWTPDFLCSSGEPCSDSTEWPSYSMCMSPLSTIDRYSNGDIEWWHGLAIVWCSLHTRIPIGMLPDSVLHGRHQSMTSIEDTTLEVLFLRRMWRITVHTVIESSVNERNCDSLPFCKRKCWSCLNLMSYWTMRWFRSWRISK